jgi:outer membrane receptor protein involved in Fe transport
MNPNNSEFSRSHALSLRRALAFGLIFAAVNIAKTAQGAEAASQENTAADKTAVQSKDQSSTTTTEKASSSKTSDSDVVTLEKVTTTGSRIRTLVGEQPAMPVLSFDSVDLERRGVSRLADIRWAIPQLGASIGFNDNMMNSGTSRAQTVSTSFNLRGLGGNSTLVLINGRRVPHTGQEAPGGAGGREDFNIDGIPVAAIDRIEVLPQGASAIYGSEAIAGVVNIILKDGFRGGELQYVYDNTFDKDAANKSVSFTYGVTQGKFKAFFSGSFTEQDALASRDRWFTSTSDRSSAGGSNGLLYTAYAGAGTLSTSYYPDPAYSPSAAKLPGLTTSVVALPSGTAGSGYTAAQLSSLSLGSHYDALNYGNQIDPSVARSVVANLDYSFSRWLRPYATVRWSDSKTYTDGTPLMMIQQLPAGYVGNPFAVPVYLSKVFYDLPVSKTESIQLNSGFNAGISGELPAGWRYDLGASVSRNTVRDIASNTGWNFTALSAAMTAATPVVLTYDSLSGKDPNAAGLMLSLLNSSNHKDVTTVTQYQGQADGPVWTGWAGDINLAAGGERTREHVTFSRFPAISYLLNAPFERTIDAGFGELRVPLLSDRQQIPFVHHFETGAAVRHERYSDMGNNTSSTFNTMFQPVKWISLRASRAEGFKAPKLYDLLAPNYSTTTTISARSNVTDTLRNNEAVIGTYNLTTGGQPNLKAEHSTSKNLGLVMEVPKIKGLSFSVDYWKLHYYDQVGSPSYQVLIDFFPKRVFRDGTTGKITGFDTSNINMARVDMKGIDYQISYDRSCAIGDLQFSLSTSIPDDRITQATPASKAVMIPSPRRTSASFFWGKDAWEAGISINYQSDYFSYNGATPYPAYIEWNPQVAYTFDKGRFLKGPDLATNILAGTKLRLTIINVFNNEPSNKAFGDNRIVMDPRLRRYVLTLSKKF